MNKKRTEIQKFRESVNVSRETMEKLQIYHDTLLKWQKRINLVSSGTIENVWKRHMLDSAQIFLLWRQTYNKQIATHRVKERQNFCWIDFGSGAGFPGMVIAILMQDIDLQADRMNIHLVESVGK